MDYKKIIGESWVYTQKNKSLIRWFGFFPSIFTTIVGSGYIAYQFFSFKTSYIFSDGDKSFFEDVIVYVWNFGKGHISWTFPLIVIGVIFFIFYFLLPTLAKASAIQTISRNRNGQEAGVGTGLKYGILSMLKMIEYHALIKTFGFFSILIEMSFVIRNLGQEIFYFLLPIFILFLFISFTLTLLFTYSDFYIVIDDDGVFESMKKSGKLVFMNWKHTFLVTVLMMIIGIRIIIQAVLVFLIPLGIFLLSGYLATIAFPIATGVVVGAVMGFIALLITAYLNGIVDIFAYTVWTYTFLELTTEKELSAREIATELVDDIGDDKPSSAHPYSDDGHKNIQ